MVKPRPENATAKQKENVESNEELELAVWYREFAHSGLHLVIKYVMSILLGRISCSWDVGYLHCSQCSHKCTLILRQHTIPTAWNAKPLGLFWGILSFAGWDAFQQQNPSSYEWLPQQERLFVTSMPEISQNQHFMCTTESSQTNPLRSFFPLVLLFFTSNL